MLNLTDMRKRRRFDREFKQMVIELSYNREDISALASELDISADLIYRWRREAELHQGASFPGQGNKILTDEQKEIARLKKELRDAQLERDILKKAGKHFLQERWQIFQFIRSNDSIFPIEKMCIVLKVSRSSYYSWLIRKPGKRDIENGDLSNRIKRIYEFSKKTYGSPRVTIALLEEGIHVSRPRVARLMKKQNLQSIIRKKWIVTTDSRHNYPVVENKLDRDFNVTRRGQVWVSDITYIKTWQGWLYLTVIIDLYDRKVIGWAFSRSLKAVHTTIPAWRMAVRNRPITQVLIFHSDRGVQYACNEFKELLSSCKLVERSMSRKGDCWDNAVAESFFKTLKVEHIYQNSFKTFEEAQLSVFEYIEAWYNVNRIHTTIKTSIRNKKENLINQLVA
ncbi:MAG: IS3 family transposase [Bacteroidales bacterium]|nr:IS3 family transposase [Bacteroidales bacterium]